MEKELCKRFIDYNKDEGKFYNNFYFDDFKLVIKLPLTEKGEKNLDIHVEKFAIDNDVYLISY